MKDQELKHIIYIVGMIQTENQRQLEQHGVQDKSLWEWLAFITEEIGEVSRAIQQFEYASMHGVGEIEHIAQEALQAATLLLKLVEMTHDFNDVRHEFEVRKEAQK